MKSITLNPAKSRSQIGYTFDDSRESVVSEGAVRPGGIVRIDYLAFSLHTRRVSGFSRRPLKKPVDTKIYSRVAADQRYHTEATLRYIRYLRT